VFLCQSAYAAAQQDFSLELTDCWSDIIPAVMTEEWKICRKGDPAIVLQSFSDVLISIHVELHFCIMASLEEQTQFFSALWMQHMCSFIRKNVNSTIMLKVS